MTILVVGQNPSGAKGTKGSALARLDVWFDHMGIRDFAFINACQTVGNGIKIEPEYRRIGWTAKHFDKVIALGNFASNALTKIGVEHFKLPHPSGLNRQINDKEFIEQRLLECRRYLADDLL